MNFLKKFSFLFVLMFFMVIYIQNGYSQSETIQVKTWIDYDTEKVFVSGKLHENEGNFLSIFVFRPGYSIEQLNGYELAEITEYADQFLSFEDGSFEYEFEMSGIDLIEGRDYQVRVGGSGISIEEQGKATFKYFSTQTINKVIEEIKTASVEKTAQMLDIEEPYLIYIDENLSVDFKDILQVDLSDYRALENKQSVHDAIAGTDFAEGRITEMVTTFVQAVEEQKNREQGQRFLDEINNIENDLRQIVEQNGEELGLDLTNPYGYAMLLEKNTLNKLYEIINERRVNQPFIDIPDFCTVFNNEVVLQSVNFADASLMENVLNAHKEIIGINLPDDYKDLTGNEIPRLHRAIALETFTDIDHIKPFFNNTVQEIIALRDTGSAGGFPGTGGGGKGQVIIADQKKPDTIPSLPVRTFTDIESVPWAIESIEVLTAKGVVEGMGDGTFRPNDMVTRAQFIKMLIHALGLPDNNAEASFSDVEKGAWYYSYIASAEKIGIVQGLGDGSFGIDRKISRQEMAILAYRAVEYFGIQLPQSGVVADFDDVEDIASYARIGVSVMQQAGIINGVGENRFAPNETATRAMAAKVIHELLKYLQ